MKDFDYIKDLWQQQTNAPGKTTGCVAPDKLPAGIKAKLLREQLIGVAVLSAIIVLILALGIFSQFFKHTITYIGLFMALAVIIMQWLIMLNTFFKIKRIDDALAPGQHLLQWEAYYVFRKKQVRWNMPLYFISLNLAMCLYLAEAVIDHFSVWTGIFLAVYIALMLFTYLVLEKMSMAREVRRIQRIINHLKEVYAQLVEQA